VLGPPRRRRCGRHGWSPATPRSATAPQCSGKPFALGTEVHWRLHFLYEDEFAAPAEVLLPVDSVVTMAATVTVADPDQAEGLRGGLFATWHNSEPPAQLLAGTVRRPAERRPTSTRLPLVGSAVARAQVVALAGRSVIGPQPGALPVTAAHRSWHTRQVFHGSPRPDAVG
jgi:hypothetical protein